MSLTSSLVEFGLAANLGDFPAEAAQVTRLAVLDAIGCGLAGTETVASRVTRGYVKSLGGAQQSSLFGTGTKVPAPSAAFANAIAVDALDYDDIGPTGQHPGCAIIPGVLAIAEETSASGAAFLDAVFAAYEVAERIGRAIAPTRTRGWQGIGPSYYGMAVALGGSRLYGSNHEQTCDAVGIAGATASVPFLGKFGWDAGRVSWLKDGNGPPAEAGVRAAGLAVRGFRGPADILDGDAGYWAMVNSDRFDVQPLTDFSQAMILDLRFKGYPACRLSHPPLDALHDLMTSTQIRLDQVERITVGATNGMAANMAWASPGTAVDAQFNTRFAIAALLAEVPPTDWYSAGTLKRADLLEAMMRIEIVADPEVERNYRDAGSDPSYVPTSLSVTLTDGSTLTAQAGWASGSPQRPFNERQLFDKFDSLATPQIGPRGAKALRESIMDLDTHDSLNKISAMLLTDRRMPE